MKLKYLVIIFSFLLMLGQKVLADSVSVTVDPKEPLINTTFSLVFKIETKSSATPYISFDANGADVLGRMTTQGVETSTTIINGRITTKRFLTYAYQLESSKAGYLWIRNIKVDLDGKIVRSPNVRVNILRKAKKAKDFFVMAVPSKTSVFVGEGIDVNYYLYARGPVLNSIVESYPKLNKFIKRFHMVRDEVETVNFNGVLYRRYLKYSARVYPEKTGKAYIDSLRVKLTYSKPSQRGGFMGFGFNRMGERSLRSPRVPIEVKALPSLNVPSNFTGLVGEHEFRLSIPQSKFLVNEAIELKLEIEGGGALENLDNIPLYVHNDLESFDTKSEVIEVNRSRAKKVFDYTYLGRSALSLDEKIIALSYFDPETEQFIEKKIILPKLIVGGVAPQVRSSNSKKEIKEKTISGNENRGSNFLHSGLVSPDFNAPTFFKNIGLFKIFNLALFFIALLLIIELLIKKIFFGESGEDQLDLICKKMGKKGITYSYLYEFIVCVREAIGKKEQGLQEDVIHFLDLSENETKYFITLIRNSEKMNFKEGDHKKINLKYNKKYFKSLINSVRKKSVT